MNTGTKSAATSTVKTKTAVSPSASVTVQTHSISSIASIGVPESRRVTGSNVKPGEGSGANVYVSGASPPDAKGNLTGLIAWFSTNRCAATVSVNTGTKSASTSTVKTKTAVSPSASVAVQTHSVSSIASIGMPESRRVVGSNVKPGEGSGINVYVSGASPPDAKGNLTGLIAWFSTNRCAATVSVNTGTKSGFTTSTVNISFAMSPSASIADSVYRVTSAFSLGVPESTRVAGLKLSPSGNRGIRT